MTKDQLDKLEQLAKAATPGPWVADDGAVITKDGETGFNPWPGQCEYEKSDEDSEYIAAVSPDVVLELIATVREQAGKVLELTQSTIQKDAINESLHAQLADARNVIEAISVQGRLKGYPTGSEWIELESIARAYLETDEITDPHGD